MLTSVDIRNFRGFRSLMLSGLQPVNLIVGKNNAGKTSLLEAIALLLDPSTAFQRFQVFRSMEKGLANQFNQKHFSRWIVNNQSRRKSAKLKGKWDSSDLSIDLTKFGNNEDLVTYLSPKSSAPKRRTQAEAPPARPIVNSCVIAANQQAPELLVKLFGNAVRRRDGEELIESQLQAVDPRIKKVRIDPTQHGNQIVVDIGLEELIPLSQLGQGIQRLVAIFSEIIGANADVCFIDEIENGVHHTHLVDLWTGLAHASKGFDVQIFATTHSDECLEAAHAAFSDEAQYDFAVIQLFREAGDIQGRVLDRELISAGIAGDIELRG